MTNNSKRAHLSSIWSIFLKGARALKMLKLRPKVGSWKPKQPKSQTNRSATYTFKILRWLKRCPPERGEATNKGKTRRFQFQSILVFAPISWSLSHISGPSLCFHFSLFYVSCHSYQLSQYSRKERRWADGRRCCNWQVSGILQKHCIACYFLLCYSPGYALEKQ